MDTYAFDTLMESKTKEIMMIHEEKTAASNWVERCLSGMWNP